MELYTLFPLPTLTRLADGFGSKEVNPTHKRFTPKDWFPRFLEQRIKRQTEHKTLSNNIISLFLKSVNILKTNLDYNL